MTYRGLTWDHPRGRDALEEAARRVNARRDIPLLTWDVQPLEGFESAPIADLAARYDLLVLDHPHIGEAVAEDCLQPLENVFSAVQLQEWERASAGDTLRSYRWQGRTYGLPLDCATQVMARRPDILSSPPTSWEEIEEIAQMGKVALSLGGPHAFLTLISMTAAEGHVIGGEQMLPDDIVGRSLERLQRLARLVPKETIDLNPIAILDAMANRDDVALVPLIFGYVTYSRASTDKHRIAFSNSLRSAQGFGGVLGGTGIGFSKDCVVSAELANHIAWLMNPQTQAEFIPEFGGQPSSKATWSSPSVNTAWKGFYEDTRDTAEHALIRPRFDGFVPFQTRAAALMRDAVLNGHDPSATINTLRSAWRAAREAARGDLDDNRMTT